MTVRQRVARLEKASPGGQRRIVVLQPEDGTPEEYCEEHGGGLDDYHFLCIVFVDPPPRDPEDDTVRLH